MEHLFSEDEIRFFRRNISGLEEQICSRFSDWSANPAIMAAVRRVPRHLFVARNYRALAYTDNALPTSGGMTTTAPSVVVEMIRSVGIRSGQKLLEIGTGTGYEAAVLAEMGVRVCSVEIDRGLARTATATLSSLGYLRHDDADTGVDTGAGNAKIRMRGAGGNVEVVYGNGITGVSDIDEIGDDSRFQGILVAASVPDKRQLRQLSNLLSSNRGRMVAFVGGRHAQRMHDFERNGDRLLVRVREDDTFDFVRAVI